MGSRGVLALLLSLLLAVHSLSEEGEARHLISSVCRQTKYYDVCVSTLEARSESLHADTGGLVLISLDACIAHAEVTLADTKLLMDNATAAVSETEDDYLARCLEDCLTQYSDALDSLRESAEDAENGDYGSVNAKVSGAMTDSGTCEDGFGERPGYTSPLTERNDYFSKLCSNVLAMAARLS